MMRKVLFIWVVLLLLLSLFPASAFAESATISTDGDYNLSGHGDGDTITISAGCTVKLIGSPGTAYHNFQIVCGAGVKLTLQNVNIDNSAAPDVCPITFTGSGNTLTLSDENSLIGGINEPAICAEDSTTLTIDGIGTINASGGNGGAGIGGGRNGNGGDITISGGQVLATGGEDAAGIGGGDGGSGGIVSISGGTIVANGTGEGAGIGGGSGGDGAAVTITGGSICPQAGNPMMIEPIGMGYGGSSNGTLRDGNGDDLYPYPLELTLRAAGAHRPVTSMLIDSAAYGTQSIYTDASSRVFLYVSVTSHSIEISAGGKHYAGTINSVYDYPTQVLIPRVETNGTYAMADYYLKGATLYIDGGISVTLTGSADTTYEGYQINCGEGVNLTLDNVAIDNTGKDDSGFDYNNYCPLSFSGANNTLMITGTNTLNASQNAPSIHVATDTSLTIDGSGTLNTTGGYKGAGIGGDDAENGGSITIDGGTVTTTGGPGAAGIGGGSKSGVLGGDNGEVIITDGTVIATGTYGAAGIGGGYEGDGGTVTIIGGIVTARCLEYGYGAGIGGGYAGDGGTVNISGGTVVAIGEYGGAGIGGGQSEVGKHGNGGDVTISGGVVFARGNKAGVNIAQDIGKGSSSTGSAGSLTLSGTGAVFLYNDDCVTPTTTHTHVDVTDPTKDMYGIPNTAGWAGGFGAYLNICTVTFVANGGSGAPGTVTQLFGTKLEKPADPNWPNHTFLCWCADEALTDEWDFDTDTVTPGLHLYAKWRVHTCDISANANNPAYGSVSGGGAHNIGASVTLKATPKSGCRFVCWKKGSTQVSASATYTFTASEDAAYTAEFAAIATPALTAAPASYNSVKLTWNKITGASGYEVYRAVSGGSYSKVYTATSGSTVSYTNTGLMTGTTYYYQVRAYCISDATTYGSFSSAKSTKPALATPTLTAAAASYSSAKLSWNKTDGASGYEVWRATSSGGSYSKVYTATSGSTVSYTNTGLATGTTYYYKVRAYRTVSGSPVNSSFSSVKSAKPALATPILTAASVSYSSVKVSWNKTDGASGYEVWRATSSGGSYSKVYTAKSGSTVSYTNTGLTIGKTYYYKVRAYRTVSGSPVNSSFSSVKSAKPALATPTLTAASASYSSAKVSWNKTDGASGYEVWRATSSGGSYSKVYTATSGSTVSYTNTGLTTGKTYYYKVRAYRTVSGSPVYGSYSSVKSAKPVPATPTGVKAAKASSSSIKVSWGGVSGASGYEVYRATSKTGSYSKVKSTTSKSYTDTGLTKGKTYYYKVRAYRTVSGAKVYGSFSGIVYYKL